MIKMRAKMSLAEVKRHDGGETLRMHPVSKPGGYEADGLDEDNTFAKFSPGGTLELVIANSELIGKFNPGDTYYLDFTKAE
jgi:hypothetical protein